MGAIEHSSGHNGKILVGIGGAGDSTLLLTQSVGGIPGNKKIEFTFDNVTASPFFTGGAPGLTGSADYAAPRQRDARRTGKSIIASRFSSPGSKEDSKQQFRDLATDQFSPNNALPFRNLLIRNVYNSQSMTFTGWGGFRNSDVSGILPGGPTGSLQDFQNQGPTALTELNQGSGSFAAIHKTQRNQTTRFQILENYPVPAGGNADANEFRTFHTASKRDNDFVQRPIPAADRIKWFTLLTGSNFTSNRNQAGAALTDQKDQWQLSGSRFPESITIIKTDYANSSSMGLHTKLAAATSANAGRKFQTITKVVPSIPGTRTSAIYSYDPWYERIQPPAPWTQTRVGNTNLGSFHRRNNLYELPPRRSPVLDSMTRDPSKFKEIFSTTIRTDIDRGHPANYDFTPEITTRNITSSHYKKFKEPPVTSRYKPLIHTIETVEGTPENINGETITLDIKYSYGNMLQGFANRDLNKELLGTRRHLLGKIKRPYDVILDYRRDEVDESISGINEIKSFAYQETVFPKEVHTYLSGTRSRLAFTNQDFWVDDTTTGSQNLNSLLNDSFDSDGYVSTMVAGNGVGPSIQRLNNRTAVRMRSPFITSQGHRISAANQIPTGEQVSDQTSLFDYDGSGSIWPLDSFLYSDHIISEITGGTTTTMRMGGNFMCTMPAGELMMPWFGRVFYNAKNFMTGTNTNSDIWTSSSINSARYVYVTPCYFSRSNVASVTDLQPDASAEKDYTCSASYPGAPFLALPPWTAGTHRRFVDGVSKGELTTPGHPFYNDFDSWKKEIQVIAKDYAIVPEFRISENLEEYKTKGSVTGLISSSLELTGATDTVFDSTDNTFLERYSTSDVMEYLNPFMQEGSFDLKSNKPPRHLELKSDAVLKLLPYDGFYPVLRSVQIATLFSQSYGEYAIYGGESASHPARWRTLMQPFYGPGIMYNSIKSGMAVSHPIRRDFGKKFPGYQDQQFLTGSKVVGTTGGDDKAAQPLAGCLSGAHGGNNNIPGNRRRRQVGDFSNFDFSDADVALFFWPDVIPFEGILKPMDHIGETRAGVVTSDINVFLRHFVTGTVAAAANQNDLLYRLAISNFLGATPEFFLKKKPEGGFMTKIVAELPPKNDPSSPKGNSAVSDTEPRTVYVDKDKAYMMEIVLKQTEEFNMYNNPCAFGIPTSTGSQDWGTGVAAATGTYSNGNVPPGRDWPKHRGEFAPFTAPYYYGPSIARFTYFPDSSKEVSLDEILNSSELFIEYLNADGFHYDVSSGSFVGEAGNTVNNTGSTEILDYKHNRAWQNRMDIDETIVIDNSYPSEFGSEFGPVNKNRWVIMPKWETPILDFPRYDQTASQAGPNHTGRYNFSSSVAMGKFVTSSATKGMWHQYGVMPDDGQGIFLYVGDVDDKATEFRMTNDDPLRLSGASNSYVIVKVKKMPAFVKESGRTIESLAKLVGFKDEEIMPPGQFFPERAKRMGELAEDGEKIISEAILAMPYYYDTDTQNVSFVNLQADANKLGPKIKEFRRVFSNYSLPPSLKKALRGLLPPDYPNIPNFINPFGGDELDEVLSGTDLTKVPVVYLMEHKIALSRQDLADIWQGIMPDVAARASLSVSSIDHYMPGKTTVTGKRPVFEEVLEKQIELGIERDGFPRVDMLDTTQFPDKNGFNPDIRWLVFKVKKRGQTDYTSMILSEINGGVDTRAFSSIFGHLAENLPPAQREELLKRKDEFTKGLYYSDRLGEGGNTFNWPYDYFSLIEMTKLTEKVTFRPDLQDAEVGEEAQETVRRKQESKVEKTMSLDPNLIGKEKNTGTASASKAKAQAAQSDPTTQATADQTSTSARNRANQATTQTSRTGQKQSAGRTSTQTTTTRTDTSARNQTAPKTPNKGNGSGNGSSGGGLSGGGSGGGGGGGY